jgi:hypothetical protein
VSIKAFNRRQAVNELVIDHRSVLGDSEIHRLSQIMCLINKDRPRLLPCPFASLDGETFALHILNLLQIACILRSNATDSVG